MCIASGNLCLSLQGIEAVPGQALAGEEDSLLSNDDQGDSLIEPSQSAPNGALLPGMPGAYNGGLSPSFLPVCMTSWQDALTV